MKRKTRPGNHLIPTVSATVTAQCCSIRPPRGCKHLLAAACLHSSAVTQPVTICRSQSKLSWAGLHLFTLQTPTPAAMQGPLSLSHSSPRLKTPHEMCALLFFWQRPRTLPLTEPRRNVLWWHTSTSLSCSSRLHPGNK